ncbi:hypothetical protein EW026_g2125 [Hermanssonia centrifuga]|uniref:General negative regulator of transcription subunit n=1 Tax=Hermanssonia centrifuga TaxID=98765 RepID=A0A4S4KTU2_9APHY|nr:hypothetical protein EW026_g2125 [Hermanssonia centrifuga]
MAARKLQTEIDRTLKKVAEGVELFESIYDKMQASTNQTQKEKLETDLKTQIKKLQRLRDQIKTWVASNDIKDKSALLENRRLIETQMEKFKACEKEMKTKAFSKEGLIQSAKLDPKQQEKLETTHWLQTQVEELLLQVEQAEAEIETLQGGVKKKHRGGAAAERLETLERLNERRKWHINRLELILRLLDNGSMATDKVNGLKDDVSYFVESNTDEDFDEDEGIYDELNLDEEEEKFGLANDDNESDVSEDASEETNGKYIEGRSGQTTASTGSITGTICDSRSSSGRSNGSISGITVESAWCNDSTLNTNVIVCTDGRPNICCHFFAKFDTPILNKSGHVFRGIRISSSNRQFNVRFSSIIRSGTSIRKWSNCKLIVSATIIHCASARSPPPPTQPEASPLSAQASQYPVPQPPAAGVSNGSSPVPPLQQSQLLPQYPPGVKVPEQPVPVMAGAPQQQQPQSQSVRPPSVAAQQMLPQQQPPRPVSSAFPGSLSDLVMSFETVKQKAPHRMSNLDQVHKLLEGSYSSMPQPQDTEKPKYYVPKNPIQSPTYYPQTPNPVLNTAGIFSQLDVETLFYVFYFHPGTYQQYLAAKELKRQSWRFHVKYLTWFQRHSEPQAITEEYEQGVYVYFDWEGSWCQRKKSDFRFEYRYLSED